MKSKDASVNNNTGLHQQWTKPGVKQQACAMYSDQQLNVSSCPREYVTIQVGVLESNTSWWGHLAHMCMQAMVQHQGAWGGLSTKRQHHQHRAQKAESCKTTAWTPDSTQHSATLNFLRLIAWLLLWLVSCLLACLLAWLVGWSIGCLVDWLIDFLLAC